MGGRTGGCSYWGPVDACVAEVGLGVGEEEGDVPTGTAYHIYSEVLLLPLHLKHREKRKHKPQVIDFFK